MSFLCLILQFLLLVVLKLAISEDILADTNVDSELYKNVSLIQRCIDAKGQPCYHNKDIHSARDYIHDTWKSDLSNDLPVLVFPFCLESASLGNWLGNYFNEASCALLSGAHFITTKRLYRQPSHADIPVNMLGNHIPFYDAFPEVVINKNPLSPDVVKSNLQVNCKCGSYCWSSPDSPWTRNVPWIKKYIRSAIEVYLDTVRANQSTHYLTTKLSNDTDDLSTLPLTEELPFIPDVAIHYRCGDNMIYGKFGYGILPYFAYLPFIPSSAKYIFVLSDHPRRFGVQGFTHQCNSILDGLFKYLKDKFPDKVIALKKGGDQFLDFARLAYANVTICSVSTFCLYPILGSNGTVYFPVSKLLPHHHYSTQSNTTSNYLSTHIHWFADPPVVTNIKDYHPWHLVKYTLQGVTDIPKEDIEGQLVKGSSRSVYLVKNFTRHAFGNMETFEGLGYKWENIWHLSDNQINIFPVGDTLSLN